MTIASEISRLQTDKECIRQAIIGKGVSVASNLTFDSYAACIAEIQTGAKGGVVDLLVVGGGGNGGAGSYVSGEHGYGGGGGAGGFIERECTFISQGSYNITVGGAGANSNFSGDDINIIAYGGGRGGGYSGNGGNGGSGGGGGNYVGPNAGCGCSGQGNTGGVAATYTCHSGGGGGGAGSPGQKTTSSKGGDGGYGRQSCITGSYQRYAGGGGGGGESGGGSGQSGGGAGAACCTCACAATTYGSGGGGGGFGCRSGASGCQGIVIIRYKSDGSGGISCATGGCKYTCGAYTIHCFTTVGTTTFTPVFK